MAWAALPDGRLRLATGGGSDGSVRVWDGHDGTLLHTLTGHTRQVYWAAWAVLPDGRLLLATGSDDGSARIWDGHAGTLLHTLTGQTERVWSVAWAVLADGGLLLAAGSNEGAVHVWRVELDPPAAPVIAGPVTAELAAAEPGPLAGLAAAQAGEAVVDRIEEIVPAGWPEAFDSTAWAVGWAVLPDGRLLLATGSYGGSVQVWDGHTGALLHTLTGHTAGVKSVAWAVLPDGRLLLATGSSDHDVRVWDGHTGAPLHTLTGHTDPIWSVAWAVLPDGQLLLATGSDDGSVRVWDGHAGALLHTLFGRRPRDQRGGLGVLRGRAAAARRRQRR